MSETSETPKPELKPRITVVETLYHQGVLGEIPTTVTSQFSRELESDEQPYQRRCKVGEDPQPLDMGWIEGVGEIHIQNEEGRFLQIQPTPEEQANIAKKKLRLGLDVGIRSRVIRGLFEIAPGEAIRLPILNHKEWLIYSPSGTIRFTITVFPR